MMGKVLSYRISVLSAALAVAAGCFAASTNLNYTAAQINEAIGYGLENSNSAPRVESMVAFVAGSNGFSNIEYSTSEISNALALAEDNAFTVARLDALDAVEVTNAPSWYFPSFTANVSVTNSFSTASGSYAAIDLSGIIGTNAAILMLEVTPSGSLGTDSIFSCQGDYGTYPVAGGAGYAELQTNSISTVICVPKDDGTIYASSVTAVDITLLYAISAEDVP